MNRKLKLWELERLSDEDYQQVEKFPIIVVLDDIRSLNNIGSFFRTADAFRIQEIILCGITATPPHRDIQKTALGATETVDWHYERSVEELAVELKKQGYLICPVEQAEKTTMLSDINAITKKKVALFFGNEVNGVKQEIVDLADYIIEIPQFGTKHSLNVAVCGGVVLWEFAKPFMTGN